MVITIRPTKPIPKVPDYGPNAIEIQDLTFTYPSHNNQPSPSVLTNVTLHLPTGSRCLLIGSNGSGKSTLLRILAGRHLTHPENCVRVLGWNAFRDTSLNFHRTYLECDWGMRSVAFAGGCVPLMADMAISDMMSTLQATYPNRRDELISLLGINLQWRLHRISEGQRRRVQLFLGLLRPFRILLLDEITIHLDVCVRMDLIQWLHRESDKGATIVYATHIFDGLEDWATHLFYLTKDGTTGWQGRVGELELYQRLKKEKRSEKMLVIADHWLRPDLVVSRETKRYETEEGAGRFECSPTDRHGGYASGRGLSRHVGCERSDPV